MTDIENKTGTCDTCGLVVPFYSVDGRWEQPETHLAPCGNPCFGGGVTAVDITRGKIHGSRSRPCDKCGYWPIKGTEQMTETEWMSPKRAAEIMSWDDDVVSMHIMRQALRTLEYTRDQVKEWKQLATDWQERCARFESKQATPQLSSLLALESSWKQGTKIEVSAEHGALLFTFINDNGNVWARAHVDLADLCRDVSNASSITWKWIAKPVGNTP